MSAITVQHESLIQDFIDVTVEVLSTMASFDARVADIRDIHGPGEENGVASCLDITAVLGFSGGRQGSLLITFSKDTALSAVGGMLGMELAELDGDVRDGIGELVNMIAGGAKTRLQSKGLNFELSIPNTVMGSNHKITTPASASRTRIDFTSEAGDFFVEVYLKDE